MFRRRADGIEVVLGEQRDRHSGATTTRLPKGKRNPGESLEETALREVAEETGLPGRIVGDLETVHYVYRQDGRPIDKTVHFYLMELAGEEVDETDGELTHIAWHPLATAQELLSFDTERRVLAAARAKLET
ncbi:MAG: NUDIX domain-containing protein [Deltaproteobacteria bacterium]|nr:NUDIX domain-containing protein [Deltaproteobacteria bacterium]MBW2361641.1 NUDIX domain-containing protein [Deltaproteobacteria bacterium]